MTGINTGPGGARERAGSARPEVSQSL